jgi:hypothetical protein
MFTSASWQTITNLLALQLPKRHRSRWYRRLDSSLWHGERVLFCLRGLGSLRILMKNTCFLDDFSSLKVPWLMLLMHPAETDVPLYCVVLPMGSVQPLV